MTLKGQVNGDQQTCEPVQMARSLKVITRVILTVTFWSQYLLGVPWWAGHLVMSLKGRNFIREVEEEESYSL